MTLFVKSRPRSAVVQKPNVVVKKEEETQEEKDAQVIDWYGWKMLHGLGMAADRIGRKSPAVAKEARDAFSAVAKSVSCVHPCGVCRTHMKNYRNKPDWPGQAFQWSVDLHNDVNRRTDKPTMPLHVARSCWNQKVPVLDEILQFYELCSVNSEKARKSVVPGTHVELQWSDPSVVEALNSLVHLCDAGQQGTALKKAYESLPLPSVFQGNPSESKYFGDLRKSLQPQ